MSKIPPSSPSSSSSSLPLPPSGSDKANEGNVDDPSNSISSSLLEEKRSLTGSVFNLLDDAALVFVPVATGIGFGANNGRPSFVGSESGFSSSLENELSSSDPLVFLTKFLKENGLTSRN